jgi:hypothetical protein
MLASPTLGAPGTSNRLQTLYRRAFWQPIPDSFLAGGKTIDGSVSRDPGNGIVTVLRAGLLMGKVTATGFYAPSAFGVTTGTTAQNGTAYTSGGTSIAVTPAAATEIVRRIGTSGNLNFIGPPSAAGTVAVIQQAFSAVNTSTGVLTITSLGANLVIGSIVAPTDGSQSPITFVNEGFGAQMTSSLDGSNLLLQDYKFPVAGNPDLSQLIPFPADTSTQAWIVSQLNALGFGQFVFKNSY